MTVQELKIIFYIIFRNKIIGSSEHKIFGIRLRKNKIKISLCSDILRLLKKNNSTVDGLVFFTNTSSYITRAIIRDNDHDIPMTLIEN